MTFVFPSPYLIKFPSCDYLNLFEMAQQENFLSFRIVDESRHEGSSVEMSELRLLLWPCMGLLYSNVYVLCSVVVYMIMC